MSTFVLTAAFYGIFSINRWSFSIFLTLQGAPRQTCSAQSQHVHRLPCPAPGSCRGTISPTLPARRETLASESPLPHRLRTRWHWALTPEPTMSLGSWCRAGVLRLCPQPGGLRRAAGGAPGRGQAGPPQSGHCGAAQAHDDPVGLRPEPCWIGPSWRQQRMQLPPSHPQNSRPTASLMRHLDSRDRAAHARPRRTGLGERAGRRRQQERGTDSRTANGGRNPPGLLRTGRQAWCSHIFWAGQPQGRSGRASQPA